MILEPIQDRRGQARIVENVAPVGEAIIVGHAQTAALVAAHERPKEQAGLLP